MCHEIDWQNIMANLDRLTTETLAEIKAICETELEKRRYEKGSHE